MITDVSPNRVTVDSAMSLTPTLARLRVRRRRLAGRSADHLVDPSGILFPLRCGMAMFEMTDRS